MARSSARHASAIVLGAILLCAGRASAQGEPTDPEAGGDSWNSPAKAADPPLLPPPPPRPPTSTSGTDVVEESPPAPSAPVVLSDTAHEREQDARVRVLEARVARDERKLQKLERRARLWEHLRFEGFIQPQLLVQSYNTAASPNLDANGALPSGISANDVVARPDGSTTNGTFFRLRRTRLRTFYETDISRFFLQIDVLPVGGVGPGIGTVVRNAEVTGIARWSRDVRTEFTAGLFFVPMRVETLEASMVRPFIERTWFVQNAFPTERDLGVHAKTFAMADRLTFDVGVLNGQKLGERYFVQTPDLNRSKDFIARVTYRMGFVDLGVSGYVGRGQVVDGEALRFKQFTRWAVNYDAQAKGKVVRRLGESRLSAELLLGQNMDTGVIYPFARPRIPTTFGDDVQNLDERAFYLRFEQDVGKYLTFGYRYDYYSPDTSIADNGRHTDAFLAVVSFSKNLRWMNEIDVAVDNIHAPEASARTKRFFTYSSVLQGTFR